MNCARKMVGGGGTKMKISKYLPPCSYTLSHVLPLLIPYHGSDVRGASPFSFFESPSPFTVLTVTHLLVPCLLSYIYGEPRDHNLVCSIEIDCRNACCEQHYVWHMQTDRYPADRVQCVFVCIWLVQTPLLVT